jgi:hypothetical protein
MAAIEDGDEQGSADLAATWIAMHQQLQQLRGNYKKTNCISPAT